VELDRIGQQLQLIYNLQKKASVATIDELLEIQAIRKFSFELGNLEIKGLTLRFRKIILLDRQASVIHDRRLEAIPILSQKMVVILDTLGMPNVVLIFK
jgi:DNA repair protein RecN (Recombination protein N)